ncbi:hypothetical protein VCSRO123_1998 [Vibrio cholerae]|nr:hypothetical protein [Vibrio cholerae]GHZ20406.1 hypothetical protein VCSRO123_1998 [Vibrio cholerae]
MINRYIIVGAFTVAVDYFVLYLCYSILSLHYVVSVIIGFIFSGVFQFFVNFKYTFRLEKNDRFWTRSVLFFVSASIGMFLATISVIILQFFIDSLYISKTLSLVISFAYGWTVSKYVIYKKD